MVDSFYQSLVGACPKRLKSSFASSSIDNASIAYLELIEWSGAKRMANDLLEVLRSSCHSPQILQQQIPTTQPK